MGASCAGSPKSPGAVRPSANCTGEPGAALATFLCPSLAGLQQAFEHHVHPDLKKHLGGILLLSLGFQPQEVQPFARRFLQMGCPVYFVETYGVLGWNVETHANAEFEERSRGSEFGAPGRPNACPGIVVVAVRGEAEPRAVLSADGVAPSLEEGAGAHCVMARFENQPEAKRFINSPRQAVCVGGFCKKAYELKGTGWVDRHMVLLTLMRTRSTAVSTCHSYAVYNVGGARPASMAEGRRLARTMPEEYRPSFIVNFQSFMRGWNAFQSPDVEAKGLARLFGPEVPTLGMFCFGELSTSPMHNPTGWEDTPPSSEATVFHSFCSTLCVFAERAEGAADPGPVSPMRTPRSGTRTWTMELREKTKDAPTTAPRTSEVWAESRVEQCYKQYLRAVPFDAVAVPDGEGISFWTYPEGMEPGVRYVKSQRVSEVDIFVSHALRPDQSAPLLMMRAPMKYALHKCVDVYVGARAVVSRMVATKEVQAANAAQKLKQLTFWVDMACIDSTDEPRKMYIIKTHLQDFLKHAKYVMILLSTHYFHRLWCMYEFCCTCKLREDLNTIVVSNVCLSFFQSERDAIAEDIVTFSVAGASCYDPRDRDLIEDTIRSEYLSIEHFERFAKFSACALCASRSVFWAAEYYPDWLLQWSHTAARLGFDKLAAEIAQVDVATLKALAFTAHPDRPAETSIVARRQCVWEEFTSQWFRARIEPMIRQELERATEECRAI